MKTQYSMAESTRQKTLVVSHEQTNKKIPRVS